MEAASISLCGFIGLQRRLIAIISTCAFSAHVSAGAPVGAGWRVSESVLNDSKVIELSARQGVDSKIFSNQFIS